MKHALMDDLMRMAEGEYEDGFEAATIMQRVINDGQGWKMEGSMGRAMNHAIEDGTCMLGVHSSADYYGTRIPARDEVAPGTKGSRGYVLARHDEDYVRMLEAT